MHILVIAQGLCKRRGGAEASFLALITHLAGRHQVTLVSGEENQADRPPVPESVVFMPCQTRLTLSAWPGLKGVRRLFLRIWATVKLHGYARSVERMIRPDLVISQKPPFPYISAAAANIVFVRDLVFITYFGLRLETWLSPLYLLQRYWGFLMLRGLARVDLVIANSEYTRSVLETHAIRSAAVPPFIANTGRQQGASVGLAGDILFLSANLSTHKGARLLIELARRLPHRRFQAVGQDIEGLAPTLPSNVQWQPWLDDPSMVLCKAAMLIVPSQWPETFGRVVVEAQRYGIPVLASQVGGLSEAVGKGGMLVRPHTDVEAWREAIEALLGDPQRYEELCREALANAEMYALGRTLERFDALLCELQPQGDRPCG